jgi:hypothetical protein
MLILVILIVVLLLDVLREMSVLNMWTFKTLITDTHLVTLNSMSKIVMTRGTKIL